VVELRSPEREVEELRERLSGLADSIKLFVAGNSPIPIWIWAIIAGLLGVGGGIAIWQFWNASQPIVGAIQQWAPLMAGAFTILMYVLAFIPFFFIFNIVTTLLPR
jgi:zinc transporter ZupT